MANMASFHGNESEWTQIFCDTGGENGGIFLFDADADLIANDHTMVNLGLCADSTEQCKALLTATTDGNRIASQYGDLIYAFSVKNFTDGSAYQIYDRKTQAVIGSGTISGLFAGGGTIGLIRDLATDPTTGVIYLATYRAAIGPTEILVFDPVTGICTYQYSLSVDSNAWSSAIAFDAAGQMYAAVEGQATSLVTIAKVDKTDGTIQSNWIINQTDDPYPTMTFDVVSGELVLQGATQLARYNGVTGAFNSYETCVVGNQGMVSLPRFTAGDTIPGTGGPTPDPVSFQRQYIRLESGLIATYDYDLNGAVYEVAGDVVECDCECGDILSVPNGTEADQVLTVDDTAGGVQFAAFHADTTEVFWTNEDATIRVTFDGSAPTTTNGHPIYSGDSGTWSKATATAAKFIRTDVTDGIVRASQFI